MSATRPSRFDNALALEDFRGVIGGVGLLFLAIAGADLVLTWLPTDFGNREWEFGTVTASFNGLLSVTLGLVMVQFWMSHLGRGWPLRMLGLGYILLALFILAAALLYGTNVPVALGAVPDSPLKTGLLKAVAKTTLQSVAYPIAYLLLARVAMRRASYLSGAVRMARGADQPGLVARS